MLRNTRYVATFYVDNDVEEIGMHSNAFSNRGGSTESGEKKESKYMQNCRSWLSA